MTCVGITWHGFRHSTSCTGGGSGGGGGGSSSSISDGGGSESGSGVGRCVVVGSRAVCTVVLQYAGCRRRVSNSHLDLGYVPYVLYGVKYIDLVSLAPHAYLKAVFVNNRFLWL